MSWEEWLAHILRSAGEVIFDGFRRDWLPIVIAALICIVGSAALLAQGVNPFRFNSFTYNLFFYAIALLLMLAILTGKQLLTHRPDRPIAFLHEKILAEHWPRKLLSNLPIILVLAGYMPIFSALKSAVPLLNDYTWDQAFIDLDIAIHGTDPWRLLQPMLGHPVITFAISLLYQVWAFLIYFGCLYFALFGRDEILRQQYFIAFFLAWFVIGVVVATMFASMGPCFMLTLQGDPHFIELIGYLQTTHQDHTLIAINIQEMLIRAYHVKNYDLGSGITAMPSMHVSLVVLVFLGMRRISPRLGWIFGIFAFVIMLGSVHLAFHYAVDSYVSIIGTVLIWFLAGYLARRFAAVRVQAEKPPASPALAQTAP
ncbi:phosphatase PAP2 family protein [Qipengyuania sp. CAU 1752]